MNKSPAQTGMPATAEIMVFYLALSILPLLAAGAAGFDWPWAPFLASQAVMFFLAMLLLKTQRYNASVVLRLKKMKLLNYAIIPVMSAAVFILVSALEIEIIKNTGEETVKLLQDMQKERIMPLMRLPLWIPLIVLVVLPAVIEEISFRGIMLSGALAGFGKAWGVMLVSFLFGIMHPFPVPIFLFSVFLAVLVMRTESIIAPITAHAVFNSMNIVFYRLSPEEYAKNPGDVAVEGGSVVAAMVVFLLLFKAFMSYNKNSNSSAAA